MYFKVVLCIGAIIASVHASQCTDGVEWTPEEFEEYLTLNDTADWAPMEKIQHCTIEESDFEAVSNNALEVRGGKNRFVGYWEPWCQTNYAFVSVENFGCGGCWSANVAIRSGALWRETTGNPYPTVDFYDQPNCKGKKIHHQGIYTGQNSQCENLDEYGQAVSFVTYQGC